MSEAARTRTPAFSVRLDNFEGPFDLLLSLIGKHKMDVTEVSLSRVTDEFIAHVKAGGPVWDLEQTTSFLLVAATLLDLKAARLLPQGDVEDEEDLALLEARDLLFARLLQYRAFKQVAGLFERRLADRGAAPPTRRRVWRTASPRCCPEVLIGIGLEQFAALAARALEPKPVEEVSLQHIHEATVSVREQGALVSRPAARSGIADLPGPVRRLARRADHGRALPLAARALPRGRGRLRAGQRARRADACAGPVRRRRGRDHRRVRRRPARAGAPGVAGARRQGEDDDDD